LNDFLIKAIDEIAFQAVEKHKSDLKQIKLWKWWSIISTALFIIVVIAYAFKS